MKLLTCLTGALLSPVALAFPATAGYPHGGPWHKSSKAVYFLRNDPQGTSVVAIKVGKDGLLKDATSITSADGVGLQSVNGTTLAPLGDDSLLGQQAVSIGGNYLFTVNPGSNTAVMFEIDPSNPLKLRMVGKPMPTLGEFAMSIAYSSKYQKACVLNGGATNGVTCYSANPEQGLVPDGVGLREFGLPGTTPAQLGGKKGGGSDIQFTGDSSKLISLYKGNNKPMTLAHVFVFDVDDSGDVASTATDNRVDPLQLPFGFALSGSNMQEMYITDAAFGGVLVSLDYETDKVSALSVVNDTAFVASCWSVWSPTTNLFYDVNAASTNIGKVDSSGKLIDVINYKTALGGGLDSVAAAGNLYVLTHINAVAVFDAESGDLLQAFKYGDLSDRPSWTGLAMYPASPLLSGGM